MTFTRALSTNNYGPAKFIVDGTTVANGTHSTIAAALTSASSGDTIFIRPGTYTENLTLKAGVNLTAFVGDGDTPNVTIIGTCTLTTAGTVSISGIRLQTNGAAFLAVTGSAASIVNLRHCYLNITNSDGITYSSSSSSSGISVLDCNGNLGTTGIKIFAHSGSGTLSFSNCDINNTGASVTASTASAGTLLLRYCILASPVTTSSSVFGGFFYCEINTGGQNVTCFTHGANSIVGVMHSHFTSGSASAIVVNAATCNLISVIINSTNTNPVSGSGTVLYTDVNYEGTGIGMSTTTINPAVTRNGISLSTKQPAFMALLTTSLVNNVTGDGTDYTIIPNTEIFDQNSNYSTSTGVFTAPYTGRYAFGTTINPSSLGAATRLFMSIVTSNRTYILIEVDPTNLDVGGAVSFSGSIQGDMDAADTAESRILVSGITKVVDINGDATNVKTGFWGNLVC